MARFWTDEEISFVASKYHVMTVRSISDEICRPENSVRMLASKLGVTDKFGATQRRLVKEEDRPAQYNPFITGKIARPTLSSRLTNYRWWNPSFF